MGLSSELASQFAKVTNDSSRNTNGTKLYGTIAMLGEVPHVKLDGTEELTPISRTVEVAEGDRVEVMIANHSATVTGNLTDPSIGIMRAGNLESKITQTAEQIQLQVSDLEKNLDSKITQTATEIRSEVSDLDGRFSENITTVENGIREDLTNSLASMSDTLTGISNDLSGLEESTNSSISTINASIETLTFNVSNLDSKITQTAAEIRSEVSAEVTDLNATIVDTENGIRDTISAEVANLDSKITQTATSIRSEVSAEVTDLNATIVNTETGIRDTINIEVANLDSKITQTATSIQTDVSAKFKTVDGEIEKFSTFKQTVEGFSFMGNGGTVKISGGDINLTGAISFSDLSDATTKQQEINAINSTASSALSTANGAASTASSALSTANDAASTASSALSTANSAASDASDAYDAASSAQSVAKSIANGSYLKGTFINGKKISSPEIEGNNIKVYGTFQTIGYDGVNQLPTGFMGAAMGRDSYGNDTFGVALSNTWEYSDGTIGNSYIIVTDSGVRMQYNNNRVIVASNGIYLNTAGSSKAYYNNVEIGSGSGGTAVFG